MADRYGDVPRSHRGGAGRTLGATIPGMRPGSHLWNLLVAVAYLAFAPLLVPLMLGCRTAWTDWDC